MEPYHDSPFWDIGVDDLASYWNGGQDKTYDPQDNGNDSDSEFSSNFGDNGDSCQKNKWYEVRLEHDSRRILAQYQDNDSDDEPEGGQYEDNEDGDCRGCCGDEGCHCQCCDPDDMEGCQCCGRKSCHCQCCDGDDDDDDYEDR